MDYRKLNQLTQKDAIPLPRTDNVLEALGGAQWFSSLDLASGYITGRCSPTTWSFILDADASQYLGIGTVLSQQQQDGTEGGSFVHALTITLYDGSCAYNFTNPEGNFTSPNHPSGYPNNLSCLWTITAAPGHYIHLYFLYFRLEYQSSYCPYDYVEVSDSNYPASSIKIKRCGYQSPWCVTSTSNALYVRLITDHIVKMSGFFASYTNHANPFSGNCTSLNATQSQARQGSCGYNFTDRQGNLSSPNYPYSYPDNINCLWTITATPGDYIYLYFTYFYVQGYLYWYGNYGYSSSCPYDYVEIFDLNYTSSSMKVRGCGYQFPWCVKSASHVIYIRFVTDDTYSFAGFTARYEVYRNPPAGGNCLSLNPYASSSKILQATPTFSPVATSSPGVSASASPPSPSGSCGYNFTDRQGNLSSPNYPYSYPDNINCLWTITATPGEYIYLYFTYFYVQGYFSWYYYGNYGYYGYNSYCPYDYVEIFDLNYPSSSIKVKGCGYQSPWCVRSKSQVMHIRFVTNSIYSYTGFTAHYAVYRTSLAGDNCLSLNPYSSSSTIIQATPTFSPIVTSTPGVSVSASPPFPSGSCGYNFTDRQGNLTSPNYPYSYPNDLNCRWTITARAGDYIYLYFTYFYVQGYYHYYYYGQYGRYGYNSYCPYDSVEVFDLNYPSSFIKVRGCGYQSPWCVKSRSHVMYIRFVTNSIYSYTGFRAHYAVYRNPPSGENCLSLNPYASSSRIIQATPIKAIYPTPASKRLRYHSSTVTPQKDPDFHLQLPSDCEQVCHNTPGSYICSCVTGYQLASDGKSCSDINECSVNNGGCSHHCYNIPGAHYCGCPEGTTMAANNFTCV
ncbi:Tolloid-like protein 2, partial [Acropora cervicornis]